MNAPALLNPESLLSSAHLILPSRLNGDEFNALQNIIGNRDLILISQEHLALDPALESLAQPHKHLSFLPDEIESFQAHLQSELLETSIVLYLPPLVNTLKGGPLDAPTETVQALCSLGLPISPLATHRTWDTKLSNDSVYPEPSTIMTLGDPVEDGHLATLQQNLAVAHEHSFSSRAFLKGSLSAALFTALYYSGSKNYVYDGNDDSKLPFQRLLAASLALSDHLKTKTERLRVGIILPPGKGGIIANLAVLCAGKVPVNLNFTAGKKSIDSAIEQAELDYFITAQRFIEKMPNFAWPPSEELLLLDELIKQLKPKALKWVFKLKFLSAEKIIRQRGLLNRRDHDEATLLFTSGSSGTPKGVPLSHRNILANISQLNARLDIPAESNFLSCLPLFHSFGSTVTTLFPLLEGYNIVTYPSPLETKKLAELVAEHNIAFLASTPTFLRGYLRSASREQFAKLRFVITAAEKLPRNLAQTFEKRFDHLPHEAYGLTETSPASYLNLPAPSSDSAYPVVQTTRPGTVGLPLTGVAIRITDPHTGVDLPISESGCIWLKGANVFNGYLKKPEVNAQIIQDGWFNTGDIGHVDQDGFLTLDGRLSRFSKIAGEMVPHETLEAEVNKILGLDDEEVRKIAIVGIPDEKKGEAIVLLSSIPEHQEKDFLPNLKKQLIASDIPALWCPKSITSVAEIPILASGKLDLAGCQQAVAH